MTIQERLRAPVWGKDWIDAIDLMNLEAADALDAAEHRLDESRTALTKFAEQLDDQRKEAEAEAARLRTLLHSISLGSQNSMTTKEDLGRQARAAHAVKKGCATMTDHALQDQNERLSGNYIEQPTLHDRYVMAWLTGCAASNTCDQYVQDLEPARRERFINGAIIEARLMADAAMKARVKT